MNRYRQLMPYVFAQRRGVLIIVVLTLISSAMAALQPWPLKILVDYGFTDAGSALSLPYLQSKGILTTPLHWIFAAGGLALVLFAFNAIMEAALAWSWNLTGQRMVASLAGDVFARLQRLPLRFHQEHSVGDSLSRLTGDCWCVYKLTDGALIDPVQKIFTLLTLGVVAWSLHPGLALCALVTAPLMALATVYFGKRIRQRARRGREAQARLLTFVHQTLAALPIVQSFDGSKRNRQRFQDLASNAVEISQRGSLQMSSYRLVTGLITTLGMAVIVFAGGRQVLAGTLSLGSFLVFIGYMRTLQFAGEGLVQLYSNMKPIEASMDRVLEILNAPSDTVRECARPRPWPTGSKRAAAVQFNRVTFGYEPGCPVLRDVEIAVEAGQVIALVGSSGAGKTTLTALLTRLYDPWEGSIFINGCDIREIQLTTLREHIAVVLQEPFLLPLTVAENIAYGRPGASRKQIETAAETACAKRFIERLPQGFDTPLGERGVSLSGGERQRLAIARAYLKDAPILILDEPTSALDGRTEADLVEALDVLKTGRTIFVVAHRLSTIRQADQIVVLEAGQVVQHGRHADLLKRGGVYHDLHRLQTAPREVVTR